MDVKKREQTTVLGSRPETSIPTNLSSLGPPTPEPPTGVWWRSHWWRLFATDFGCIALAVLVPYVVRFDLHGDLVISDKFSPKFLFVSITLAAAWLAALDLTRSRDRRLQGSGTAEYSRVFSASWRLFALVAVAAYLSKLAITRGYLAIAFPLGLILLLSGRFAWRQWLHYERDRGRFQSRILVIGPRKKAAHLIEEFHRNPRAGFAVVGVCLPTGEIRYGEHIGGVPLLGTMEHAADVALATGVTAVAVAGSDSITYDAVRNLGWDLEGKNIDLALALTLIDVAGPRVVMQPVNGLPLVYVDEARFRGSKFVAKSAFDLISAGLATILLAPLLIVIAILVMATSPGPALYRQERIGKDGRRFQMLKFRSMVPDADKYLEEVLASEGIDAIPLFYKPKHDPRITPLGRFLRRFSLDELPQLFNILRGEMSVVGPRPQIAAEVALYDRTAHRRLLVKPGLTGLWQVSGRSDLPPEEGIRMDITYVENWTLLGDILIIFRTLRAILTRAGAY